ncbi:MAG: hypothetical protein AAFZ58_06815, partial [Pseudomonadota bacterium]
MPLTLRQPCSRFANFAERSVRAALQIDQRELLDRRRHHVVIELDEMTTYARASDGPAKQVAKTLVRCESAVQLGLECKPGVYLC